MFTHKTRAFSGAAILIALFVLGDLTVIELFSLPHAEAATSITRSWEKPLNDFAVWMGYAVMFVNVLGFLALQLVDYFFRPDFLGHPGMMGPDGALRTLWILSRDIMNLIFAAMLIGMAFYTIVTGNKERLKTHIVSFVLAIILVNFSWFFPRVIIDVAHVMTGTVFSIPDVVIPSGMECKALDKSPCTIVTKVSVFPDAATVDSCVSIGQQLDPSSRGCKCLAGESDTSAPICWWVAPWVQGDNRYGIINGLAVNFGRLTGLAQVAEFDRTTGGAPTNLNVTDIKPQFFFNLVFSAVFGLALVFPLLGLAVGLMLRVLILWITIAFMPFVFLGFVINNGKLGTNVFGFERDLWKEFMAAAFLPVLVALPISVGFVMVMVGATHAPAGGMLSGIEFNSQPISGIDDFWQLMWAFFALIILWTGAFAALKRSDIIGGITEKIRTSGEGLGKTAAKLPLLTPLPMPGGGTVKLGTLLRTPQVLETALNTSTFDGSSLIENFKKGFSGKSALEGERKMAATELSKAENKHHRDTIKRHLATLGSTEASVRDKKKAEDELRTLLQTSGLGLRRETLETRESMLGVLEEIDRDITSPERFGIEARKAKEMSGTRANVAIQATTTDNKSTHVTINGTDVDLRGLGSSGTALTLLKEQLKIDPDAHNSEEGFNAAIKSLNEAASKLEAGDTRAKTEAMAKAMQESLQDGSKSLRQAWEAASDRFNSTSGSS